MESFINYSCYSLAEIAEIAKRDIPHTAEELLILADDTESVFRSLRRENAELKKLIEDANDILARYISSRDLGDE